MTSRHCKRRAYCRRRARGAEISRRRGAVVSAISLNETLGATGRQPECRNRNQVEDALVGNLGKVRSLIHASMPGIADGLGDLGCLRDAPDLAARNRGVSAGASTRPHAIMRRGARRRMVRELCCTVLRKGGAGRLHVRRARLELMQAIELLVDPLKGGGKDLLAPQRLIGSTRKALAARLGFPPELPLLLPRQRPRLVALLPQAQLQRMQLVGGELVDGGVMRDANQLKLVVAEPAAFRLAWQRHSYSPG